MGINTGNNEKSLQEAKKDTIWSVPFVTLMVVNLFQSLASFMCNTTLPLYANALGASTAMVGVMVGSFAVSSLLVRPFAGPAFDAFSRKRLLIVSQATICICLFCYGVVDTYESLIAVRLVHGIGIGCSGPLGMSLVSEYLPASKFASGISVYTLAQSFAQVIGPATGLYLIDMMGFSASYFFASACLLVAMIGVFLIKEPYHTKLPYQLKFSRMFAKEALGKGAALMLLATAFSCITSYVVLYGYSCGVENMGLYFAVYAGCLLLTRPLFGNLADRVGTPRVLVLGIICFTISYFILFSAKDLGGFLAAAVVGAGGFGSCAPLLQSLAMASVPIARRGAASNTAYTGFDLGVLVGPIIGGTFVELATPVVGSVSVAYSYMWLVMLIFVAGAFAIVLFWLLRGRWFKQ